MVTRPVRAWLIVVVALSVLAGCSGPDERDEATATGSSTEPAASTTTEGNPTQPEVIVETPTGAEVTVQPTLPPTSTAAEVTATSTATVGPGETPTATATATAATEPSPTATATSAPPVDLQAFSFDVEQAGSGFSQPDFVTHAGDGTGRIFVLEKTGSISLLDGTTYLDITGQVLFYDLVTEQHELGLLGLAFHPDFESNGYFYVHYTDLNQDHVISRFVEGPNGLADPASETILLTYDQPDINFVGGMLAFGRDGYLYIGMGTGTSVDADQVVAQEFDNLYGKILRIDVDGGDPYGIPADNPFVDVEGARPEVWAYGLRNPWRFTFDRVTNDLYIGGPGEFVREWVNFVEGGNAAGLNFGWPIIEGNECWEAAVMPCDTAGLEFPIIVYPRANGNCVIIGGYPFRGASQPALGGAYFYGDYCSGRIWAAARDAEGVWNTLEVLDTNMLITSFGEDEAGELYVVDGLSGSVYRIIGT